MKKLFYLFIAVTPFYSMFPQFYGSYPCDGGSFEELNLNMFQLYGIDMEEADDIYCSFGYDLYNINLFENNLNTNEFGDLITFTDNDASISGGYDPTLYALNVNVPRTSEGMYAIKLNDNAKGYSRSAIMKTFSTGATNSVSFKYSIIASNPSPSTNMGKPKFIAELYMMSGWFIGQLCIDIDDNNPLFNKVGTGPDEVLYTGWQCGHLTLPQEIIDMNPDIILQFVISDGMSGNDFATVYIDDICDKDLSECTMESCDYCLYLDQDVTGIDLRKAEYCIGATNSVYNGAVALYHAGTEILLSDGFESLKGSVGHYYIEEDCTADFEGRPASSRQMAVADNTDTTASSGISIYPNPIVDRLKIDRNITAISGYKLYSPDGKLLMSGYVDDTDIDVSNLISGVYILSVQMADGNIKTQKVIKK